MGGLKVVTRRGWFAASPAGAGNVYKLYTESFAGEEHLRSCCPAHWRARRRRGNRTDRVGGLKVVTRRGWFAARSSGAGDVYKLYAESFAGEEHLRRIQQEAREMVSRALPSAVSAAIGRGLPLRRSSRADRPFSLPRRIASCELSRRSEFLGEGRPTPPSSGFDCAVWAPAAAGRRRRERL